MSESGDTSGISSALPLRVGRYRVTGLLGRGAMGMVYLGHDAAIDRQVAIKTIHRRLLRSDDSSEWLERFRREVRAAGRCLHSNIVTVFEYGEEAGAPYIVMEYVQGRELRDYLKDRQPMPLRNAVAIILQVLQALGHAHAQGVVHRDIKPGNIILLADGQVKVTDFGIARLELSGGLTQVGMAVGTPGYMAPEQFSGQEVDRRADLYAAGVVLFELLTGVRPFSGRGAGELMYQVLNESPLQATRLNPRLPMELDALFIKALAKAPDQRFQEAGEFVAALENLRLVEREVAADGSTVIRVEPVRVPEPPAGALPGWDPAMLAQTERVLVETLGPVARLLVRKTAQQVGSPAELAQQLAAAIPGEPERLVFQRRMRAIVGGTLTGLGTGQGSSVMGSQVSASMGPFDQNFLETVRRDLAAYLGPIAKVLVKQAAGKARTPQELYQRLAEQIPTAADRATFLKRAPPAGG
ncbi:MAG TPA: serine/threonine-protein kinase [Candidatus Competibacteraceae bacterium]|nr:serine/threonine-protein kinase [Candidatus Competibacteraceae bacterium]HRZ05991.1 serine/threonine-protein kinase [Candidatus Competibacteraceae bacterium]HSA46650.1 serine/threonine-protein kinase [Candidatus Competibacteraceae bacterium]